MIKVTKKFFSGTSHIFDGTLAAILRNLMSNVSISVLAAAAVTQLVDNGGGASDGVIDEAVPAPAHVLVGSDSISKANAEAAFATARDAISEVVAQCNTIASHIPVFPTLVDSSGGVADGTVDAITVVFVGTNASMVSLAGFNTAYAGLFADALHAAGFVNELATAVNLPTIGLPKLTIPGYAGTFASVSTGTGGAVSGADLLANATVSVVDGEAAMVSLADAVKELTVKLHTIIAATPTQAYIAA